MPTVFERRMAECRERLGEDETLVTFPGPNLYYLTGVRAEASERHFLLFVTPDASVLFVPELAEAQVRDAESVDGTRTWGDREDPTEGLSTTLDDLGIPEEGRLLVDDRLPARFLLDLRGLRPDAEFDLAEEVLVDLRLRKDEGEIEALREASEMVDEVQEIVRELGEDAIGATESELARRIDAAMRERGGEPSFETIVASGPNGAIPHYHHGDRAIERGDPVVLDFGCYLDAYPSDQTRTVVFAGEPSAEFESVFETVREAQESAVGAVEPGVAASQVDRAARSVIEDAGYGDAFVHRTGHGVGLDVHEPPYIASGNDRELEEGMVFSVEPGIYLEGEFGVRIEDLVVVTSSGCERLNETSRGWRPS